MRNDNLHQLPAELPVPEDHGAARHLSGMAVASVPVPSTGGRMVRLDDPSVALVVVFCYPRTGQPDAEPLGGWAHWNSIPGARGCTPQSCAYRDHHKELRRLGAVVYGLSTQTTEYQREAVARLGLPFELLSDGSGAFLERMRLPSLEVTGVRLWVLGDLAGLDRVLRQNAAAMSTDQEIVIRDTKREDLERICEMEQGEARNFVIPYSLQRHQAEFAKPGVLYKSIWNGDDLIGFVILVLDPDKRSVEFRRIVIARPGRGFGKRVVRMMDEICRSELDRTRLWLDVFETNERAQRVYEQCGYRRFGKSEHEGKTLLLYEKVG